MPEIFKLLKRNVAMDALQNVVLNPVAVSNRDGDVEFEIFKEPSISCIRRRSAPVNPLRVIKVPSVCLNTYWKGRIKKVDSD